jgi:hypothetical protein
VALVVNSRTFFGKCLHIHNYLNIHVVEDLVANFGLAHTENTERITSGNGGRARLDFPEWSVRFVADSVNPAVMSVMTQ